MDSRASTRTRLSVIPVFIALVFNLVVPIVTIAVPEAAPEALQPQTAGAASDPVHVSFTLEGCRLENGAFIEATITCEDAAYTSGNLGKEWNELDLVPHRLTTQVGTQAAATTTYTFGIAADREDGGAPGYDVLSAPVINDALSHDSCMVSSGPEQIIEPGVGGTDKSIGRLVTVTQDKGTTCVLDWYERLALGSHLFPGASLHTNRTNQQFSTSGIGAADVSIPVNEILPQQLSKTMTAEQGQKYNWEITKSANPGSLSFTNTCLETTGSRSQDVQITVSWTRSEPTASGDTTITTTVTAINPAHRLITVQATDSIYEGAGQGATELLETVTGVPVDVPAGTSMVVLSHTFVYDGQATTFNDVATATYTDKLTGIAVPGQTSATASATAQPSVGAIENASVVVSDTEDISGEGLSFAVAAPLIGAFTGGYAAGASTTEPVGWQFTASESGSVTFTKTVTVDQPRITSGTLSDTATITGDNQMVLDTASASVGITASAQVSLQINKTIPAGSLRTGESVTFDFDVTGPGGYDEDASITFAFGDDLTKSTTLSGLAPGTYTVHEVPQGNWADHTDQADTITLPDCSGSVSFNNNTLAPDLDLLKTTDHETVTAGDPISFAIELTNSSAEGTGVAKDVTLDDALPFGDGIDWSIDSVTGIGGFDPAGLCSIVGSPPNEDLDCNLGDLAPGEGVRVELSSDTTADSCGRYSNTAEAAASNHAKIPSTASTTVLCPELEIDKLTTTPVINAGEVASYTVTLSNLDGDAPATDVDLVDTLPSGVTWSTDNEDCDISAGILSCLDLTIPAGGVFSVIVTGTTDEGECPSILNRATFTSGNAGSGETHVEGQGVPITVNCPDLEVEKEQVDAAGEPTNEPVDAGLPAYFAIHVTNQGLGTAFDVDVLDFAPDGTVWTVVDDGGFDCPDTIDDAGDTCTAESMAPGTATIILSYLTSEADCGTLVNNVEVSASNEPAAKVGPDNAAQATITVECPGLNLTKTAQTTPIDAGEEASFLIHLWNSGPGDALGVELHDDLPPGLIWDFEIVSGDATDEDCDVASSQISGEEPEMSIDCDFGTIGVTDMAGGIIIRVFADTDRTDCGLLENNAWTDASNADRIDRDATITVKCPTITLEKENDAVGSVLPGTTVTYTLTLTVTDGPANDVVVEDDMPVGLEDPTSISDGGALVPGTRTIRWELGNLNDGTLELTYNAVVADDVENGEELVNAAAATSTNSQCPDFETLGPECQDGSTVITRVPTLVIDKVADTQVITITGPNDALVATPSVVTWTLTYTLTNGPVTNAVITDEIPVGFEFLDASDGGELVDGSVVWTFETLTESGSVTFRTTVDPDTISRVAPTVNVAVIDSDETAPDEGQDSVTVTVQPPVLGGNPTPKPKPSLPDTASGIGLNGQPITVPLELLAAFFIGSLGALALANVKARSRRR